ncbi:M48 family metalloprotease [Cronobacter muytjensii]|nr:M48 family metalloprotease [Cronobacter muytjensii]
MTKKSFAYLFLLPLAIFLYAVLQHYRVATLLDRAEYEQNILVKAEKIVNNNFTGSLEIEYQREGADKAERMYASSAQTEASLFLSQNKKALSVAKPMLYLSYGGLGLSLLFLLTNSALIALGYLGAKKGRRSQHDLVQAFDFCRTWLPFILAGQVLFLTLSVSCLIFYELTGWMSTAKDSGDILAGGYFFLLGIGYIVFIIWRLVKMLSKSFSLFQPEPKPVMGRNLTHDDAPALWARVERLALKLETITPDNIVAGLTENFYVTANPVRLNTGEILTGQTLYFSLPWAALLDEAEIDAVLGHELGHFSGKDTEYSLRFAPLYARFSSSIEAVFGLRKNAPGYMNVDFNTAMSSCNYVLGQFHDTVMYWRQRREHGADEMGAKVSTPLALSSSLLRIAALSNPVDEYLNEVYNARVMPDDVVAALLAHLQMSPLPDPQRYLENETAHPYDTHPSCKARIEALGCTTDEAAAIAARPVTGDAFAHLFLLINDFKQLCRTLSAELTGEITQYRDNYKQSLETVLHRAAKETVIYARPKIAIGGALVFIFFLYVTVGGLFDPALKSSLDGEDYTYVCLLLGLAVISGLGLRRVIKVWKRGKQPVMVLRHGSISVHMLSAPVPLAALTGYVFFKTRRGLRIGFTYKEGYEPPPRTDNRWLTYTHCSSTEPFFYVTAYGKLRDASGAPVSQEQLAELLDTYLSASVAEHEIKDFQ